ncbi:hypothetical protein [Aestuariibacter salexigens]|uniref:hypothetical protein n=1 Tax=Aestuariibacter salexigens TaxID=226010 RepID=UPI0005554798|nr:hypothetical protein [Aestuariibacter salexigens]
MSTTCRASSLTALCLLASYAASAQMETQTCPSAFHDLPLHQSARLCQTFDDTVPASLVYHADVLPSEAADFYSQQNNFTFTSASVKGRTVLTTDNQDKIVVISADGDGAQIDILIK